MRYFLIASPLRFLSYLLHTRFAHFFVVGATGVLINLSLTAFFAELVFGRENYFSAYLIGLTANLLYNFSLHTLVTFKTKHHHALRLALFLAYSLALAYVQAQTVRYLADRIGVDWYLVIIASVILAYSVVTFFLFKFALFKDRGARGGGAGSAEV